MKLLFASRLKTVYPKKKEFAQKKSKFVPFKMDFLLERLGVQESKQEVTKCVSLVIAVIYRANTGPKRRESRKHALYDFDSLNPTFT